MIRASFSALWMKLFERVKELEEEERIADKIREKIGPSGRMPLYEHPAVFASVHDIPEIIKYLSPWSEEDQKGLFGKKQWSPLHHAIMHESEEVILALLQAGFKADIRNKRGLRPIDMIPAYKKVPIMNRITIRLFKSCLHNDIEVATLLCTLAEGFKPILNGKDSLDRTPLMRAAHYGFSKIVQILIDKGASLEYVNSKGETALSEAILDVVSFKDKGPSFYPSSRFLRRREDPFSETLDYRKKDVTEILLAQENITSILNIAGPYDTPLMIAAYRGFNDAVRMLLDRGADLEYVSSQGETALSEALLAGNKVVVDILLKQKNISSILNVEGPYGAPLMIAARRGLVDIVKIMLDKGASLEHISAEGKTALSEAFMSMHSYEIESPSCLSSTPSKNHRSVRYDMDFSKKTSPEKGLSSREILYQKKEQVIGMLLAQESVSSIINIPTNNMTPLMLACKEGFTNIVKKLLRKGASLEYISADGRTALSNALQHRDIVRILLSQKEVVTIIHLKNHAGTPIRYALKRHEKTALKHSCLSQTEIDIALDITYALTRYGMFLPDDLSLSDIRKFPILYAVLLTYFKPIFQEGSNGIKHGYTEQDLMKMRAEFYSMFSLATSEEKLLMLTHIESEELIAMLKRDKEVTSLSLGGPEASETLSPQCLSVDNLIDYHRKGFINLVELFPLGMITLNQTIIEASLALLEDIPDEALTKKDFSILHGLILSSYIAHGPKVTKYERMKRTESIRTVLAALDVSKASLISTLLDSDRGFSFGIGFSSKRLLERVSSDDYMMQRILYQRGANPFEGANAFYKTLCLEENIGGLITLFESCEPSYACKVPHIPLSSSAVIRLLSKVRLEKNGKSDDFLFCRIIELFKLSAFTSQEDHAFPVQEYTVDDIIKLHQIGKIDLLSVLPVLFEDYKNFDEKLFTACYQLGLIDFFSSNHPHGTCFHDLQDGRYFSLFSDFLREEVNKRYNPDKKAELEKETYQKYEALLHAFIFSKSDDIPSPFETYEVENESFYDEIKQLYTEDDDNLASEVSKEELELLADFKRRCTEHHALKIKSSAMIRGERSMTPVTTAPYLPSTSVVCASSSAKLAMENPKSTKVLEAAEPVTYTSPRERISKKDSRFAKVLEEDVELVVCAPSNAGRQELFHHQASEAAAAEPMEMSTHGFG